MNGELSSCLSRLVLITFYSMIYALGVFQIIGFCTLFLTLELHAKNASCILCQEAQ